MFLGTIPGSIGETSTLAILIGAVILIATGIGSWRIMLGSVVGLVVMACLANAFAGVGVTNARTLPAHYHMVMGGWAFATVFMATDPVSAAATNIGKFIYGFLIGVMTVLIRCFNPAYPEGAMLAVLFLNAFAPLIDYVVVSRHMARRLRRAEA
jgi:Na+-transporting NADH:ubiquinone oxidoreductase subunit B